MEKYVECQNCKEQYDCERTYLGGCTDGKQWEKQAGILLKKKDKELYYKLERDCGSIIEHCPNEKERKIACEYCRYEYIRKNLIREIYEYAQKFESMEEFLKEYKEYFL